MKFTVIVPARFASSRFPGKPLKLIGDKPMVVHVCEQAARSGAAKVVVATDHARIAEEVKAAGFKALMTREDHPSGTDRVAEAAVKLRMKDHEIVVNVQGDEPLIDPGLIRLTALTLEKNASASMSTACHKISDSDQLSNPNVVKVVLDAKGCALYFSRSQIPYRRGKRGAWYRHAGIYAYRVGFLKRYPRLKQSPLEQAEALEQLRALWHGYKIAVVIAQGEPEPSVDTPADLIQVIKVFDLKCD